MPLREINVIELGNTMYINYTMKNTYKLGIGDVLVCQVKRHFNSRKEVVNKINKTFEIELKDTTWIDLNKDVPELTKYGIEKNDYLEVVYTHIKRDRETIEVFPGETKEYLDFIPAEK